MEHTLKTIQPHFARIEKGEKTFEIRKDDRGYKVGDLLILKEWDPKENEFTLHQVRVHITHILRDAPEFGLMPGYCILSIK